MALVASSPTNLPLSFSIGPVKQQVLNLVAQNGDVSGTITADRLTSIASVHVCGLTLTAAPTISGNVVTLAFADPLAAVYGSVIILGK